MGCASMGMLWGGSGGRLYARAAVGPAEDCL